MANLGLDIATVGATLQTAFNGNDDSKFRDGSEEYDIIVKLDQFDRRNREDIGNITIPNNDGDLIRLKQFADIVLASGPAQLDRFNRMPSVTVKSQAVGVPTGTIGEHLKAEIAQMDMPSEISVNYAGDLEMQGDAFATLLFAFAVSIFIVYLIMVALYDSYVYPFVVMFSIPLAIIGALLALAMAKQTLSIFTILGIIMLIGLVAKNAILVVDFTNQLKREGKKVKEALLEASETRFRPILMTTLAMVIGMMPIALAGGAGAEWKNGLAWALIGGLISSMFLTLVVVPVIYYMFDKVMERFGIISKVDPEIENL
jgi:HAE1 family hydrophobic/amphiphilic exporter-1